MVDIDESGIRSSDYEGCAAIWSGHGTEREGKHKDKEPMKYRPRADEEEGIESEMGMPWWVVCCGRNGLGG